GIPTFFILLDNLRFDQWKVMESAILEYFNKEEESYFYSLLPSATQYSRNAIFSGLLPIDIAKKYPQWWKNDFDEGGKNMFEAELFNEFIKRNFRKEIKFAFEKVTNTKTARL
ncbi:MAG TPA: two-component system response regulator, partial [Saprospirales bacterium]|nr:two-component system response regulator [Saprospirales bacterium]